MDCRAQLHTGIWHRAAAIWPATSGRNRECNRMHDSPRGILPSARCHESRPLILLAKSQNPLQHVYCKFRKSSVRRLLYRPNSGFVTELTIILFLVGQRKRVICSCRVLFPALFFDELLTGKSTAFLLSIILLFHRLLESRLYSPMFCSAAG